MGVCNCEVKKKKLRKISILKELGAQPSSVQIANKIIWVEEGMIKDVTTKR